MVIFICRCCCPLRRGGGPSHEMTSMALFSGDNRHLDSKLRKVMATLSRVVLFLRELISFVFIRTFDNLKYIFHQGFRDGRRRLPDLDKSLLSYSATKLAAMIREKEVIELLDSGHRCIFI